MELLNEFLIQYGYAGMCIAAFLAGSFVPFNSEVVMAALLAASDMNPWLTVIWGTVGNVAGAMFNYYIGRLGDADSIAKRIHLKKSGVERVNHLVRKFGGLMGFFTFLPAIGTVICLVLGVMRANPFVVLITSTIGKFLRYAILAYMVFSIAH